MLTLADLHVTNTLVELGQSPLSVVSRNVQPREAVQLLRRQVEHRLVLQLRHILQNNLQPSGNAVVAEELTNDGSVPWDVNDLAVGGRVGTEGGGDDESVGEGGAEVGLEAGEEGDGAEDFF